MRLVKIIVVALETDIITQIPFLELIRSGTNRVCAEVIVCVNKGFGNNIIIVVGKIIQQTGIGALVVIFTVYSSIASILDMLAVYRVAAGRDFAYSRDATTSAEVISSPLWNLTPLRKGTSTPLRSQQSSFPPGHRPDPALHCQFALGR